MEENLGTEEKKSRDAFYIILLAILGIGCGVLGWQVNSKGNQLNTCSTAVADKTKQLDTLEMYLEESGFYDVSNESLTEGLNEMLNEYKDLSGSYDSLSSENQGLGDSIIANKAKIADLLAKVEKNKGNERLLRKYKKEMTTLRSIMKGYVHTIDSLNTLIIAKDMEIVDMSNQRDVAFEERDNATDKAEELEKTVAKGSVLQTLGLTSGAIRVSNRGKQSDTRSSSRAKKIKSCFTIAKNSIARKGKKNIYMRVISPDGVVLANGTGDEYKFKMGKTKGYFSEVRQINYENEALDICVYYELQQEIPGGDYIVELWADREKIGSDTFTLK